MASTRDFSSVGNCRFYEKEFPDAEDTVLVNVKSIAEMGAYVELLEYNGLEGMILLSELSRRRIRSINKLLRVGKTEVVSVLRVDKDSKYIDLSKKSVSPEDIARAEERYSKAKTVHALLRNMALKFGGSLLSFMERIAWPLDRLHGSSYDALQQCAIDPTILKPLKITDAEKEELIRIVRTKMAPQPIKIRADINVTCFKYKGIEAIREALLAAEALSTTESPLKVQLVAAPLYVVLSNTTNKDGTIALMNEAIEVAKKIVESYGGSLIVKAAPSVTSAEDQSNLAKLLADLKLNSGDSDESDDDFEEEEEEGMAEAGGGLDLGDIQNSSVSSLAHQNANVATPDAESESEEEEKPVVRVTEAVHSFDAKKKKKTSKKLEDE